MMNMKLHIVIILTLIVATLAACAPRTTSPAPVKPAATQVAPTVPSATTSALTPERSNWDKVVDAAKKEGEVTIYSFNFVGDVGLTLSRAFKNRYGITMNIITGRGAEFIERLKTEKRTGLIVADMAEGSITHLTNMKESGVTIPLSDLAVLQDKSEWHVDPKANDAEAHILATFRIVYSPWINTRLVTPQQVPKSYQDMLKPEWKGKIIAHDTALSSAAYNYFVPLINNKVLDWEYVRALGRQQLRITPGGVQAAESLARGEYPVIFMNTDTNGARFVSEGAPIKAISYQEGDVANLGGQVVIGGSPHPNAAKVLANWLLMDEGQKIRGELQQIAMVRKGIPDFRPANAQAPSTKTVIAQPKDYDDMARLMRERYIPELWKN